MDKSSQCRRRLRVNGLVQGVGFRPFVYCLATELQLSGGVQNTAQGVEIEIEGSRDVVAQFLQRLRQDLPPHASIGSLEQQALPVTGIKQFEIWSSSVSQRNRNQQNIGQQQATPHRSSAQILPDLATCPN
ncbi:MAG: acylphosphatase, partial [Cyanobacteria bacterium J06555_13]